MARMTIAVLEDDARRTSAMKDVLRKRLPWIEAVFFDNAPDMVAWLGDGLPIVTLLCLDHDLGPNRQRDGTVFDPGIGRDVVDFLVSRQAACPVLIHSSNVEAALGMLYTLQNAGWVAKRVVPSDDLGWVGAAWSTEVGALLA